MLDNILSLLPIILAVVVVLAIILTGYVKAPPDQAYIISGLKKESKVLIGRAGIRVPFFERMDRLYLGQMTVDIKTEQSVPTSDFINVNVDAVAKVRISPHAEGIKLAAKNFLNKRPEEITRASRTPSRAICGRSSARCPSRRSTPTGTPSPTR